MDQALIEELMTDIRGFLRCPTPQGWIDAAVADLPTLLVDHANCEKKAANTAIALMYKYIDRRELLTKMSKLAREELVHFDQVTKIMYSRDIEYIPLSAARYAAGLHKISRKEEPDFLVDKCIIGSIVEARSCERFASLIPFLDDELAKFYYSLLKSEGRHFRDYLKLAELYSDGPIDDRIDEFLKAENELIESPDVEFRFHSGVPQPA
jgi:tRNA-(ms[2]io[6]A)-hydroxylase